MSNTQIQLRKIVAISIIIIVVLLVSTIVLSVLWPSSWNPLLGSLFLNIAASLIGVLVGVLIAIFVVERYLQHQRNEMRKREHSLNVCWIYGGLSVLIAMIMHLSFYLLYGKRNWQVLMITGSEQIKVPATIGDFIPWLINDKDKLRPGVTKEKLAVFKKEFNKTLKPTIKITRGDLEILVSYMEECATRIRDQFFLFQPFIHEYFEQISSLIFFAHSLDNVAHDSKFSLALMTGKGKSPSSFHLDEKGQALFHSLGKEAIEVSELILAGYDVKFGEKNSQLS